MTLMTVTSLFSAEIVSDAGNWTDWFTWEDEGGDWRRVDPTLGYRLDQRDKKSMSAKPKPIKTPNPYANKVPAVGADPEQRAQMKEEKRCRRRSRRRRGRRRGATGGGARGGAGQGGGGGGAAQAKAEAAEARAE